MSNTTTGFGADTYAERRGRVAARLREEGIGALLIEDTEGRRDPAGSRPSLIAPRSSSARAW